MTRIAELVGSHAEGSLQIGQQSINHLLTLESKKTAPSVELLAHNQVVMRYGLMRARAELLPAATQRASPPNITLRLASTVVAMAMKTFVRQPFVHINGRDLTIVLAADPSLATVAA